MGQRHFLAAVKDLAESYSEFNAYWNYLYKLYSGKEDDSSIKVRSALIAMRSSFLVCVEGLSRLNSLMKNRQPYSSILPEAILYSSNAKTQVNIISNEYHSIKKLLGTETDTTEKIFGQMGEAIELIKIKLASLGSA